jgi:LacI family transcriptional regulator, gluconate utilization system Gnt-I transcriptional repressor
MSKNYSEIQKRATLKDVAKVAGVSPITVSRFVNTPSLVRESSREKIIAAITETGYIPNAAARQLKTNMSNVVYLIVPSIKNELYATISHELMLQLSQCGKTLFICDYNFQYQLEEIFILEIIKHRPAAIVMASGEVITKSQAELLKSSNIPVIQFDRINDDIDSPVNIQIDNYNGGKLAGEYFLTKRVKQVVVFSGNTEMVLNTRIRGISDVLEKAKVDINVVELDLNNSPVEGRFTLDLSGDTGYFLLNSDITNSFLLKNVSSISQFLADRIISFDSVRNADFLPFKLTKIDYNISTFISLIFSGLTEIFECNSLKSNDVSIPVTIVDPTGLVRMK